MTFKTRFVRSAWRLGFNRCAAIALLAAFALLGCEPVNVQDRRDPNGDDQARERRVIRTRLSPFYGVYQTLMRRDVKVSSQGQTVNNCDTITEIDNANISRYRPQPNGGMKVEAILLDYFDPSTREFLAADEIWVASGAMRGPNGREACADFAVPIFAGHLGTWTNIPNGIEYQFRGTVLRRIGEENRFEQLYIDETIRVRRLDSGLEIGIRYDSKLGFFDEVWSVRDESQPLAPKGRRR